MLFSSPVPPQTKKNRIWSKATEYADDLNRREPVQHAPRNAADPLAEPNWNYQPSSGDKAEHKHRITRFIEGMKRGVS